MRLKDLTNVNSATLPENTHPNYSFQYIDISSVSSDGVINLGEEIQFYESPSRARRIVKEGDVLISTVRTYLKAIASVSFDIPNMIASTGFAVCSPKSIISSKYLAYATRTDDVIDAICKDSTGVSYPAITASRLSSISIPFCLKQEQDLITSYLDGKIATIDNRINTLKKEADAYSRLKSSLIQTTVTKGLSRSAEHKDSGINWIGEIPSHWKRVRIKDIGHLYSGLTGKSGDDFRCDDDTVTKPFIPFTNILNNTQIDLNQFCRVVMSDGESQNIVKENDLIFLMSSEDYESIAKSAVVVGNPGEVYLNSFCRGLRITKKDVYAPFVNYQLNSEKYRDSLRFEARGFTRINIKVDRIASQFVTLPPYDEQVEIAIYLDKKCADIESNIKNIDKQIEALKILKRALINEVITGKRAI